METGDIAADRAELILPPVLDLRAAVPLHRDLLDRCGAPLRIDARAVERIGGQCAAVLLSAGRQWAADGHELRLESISPALRDGLTLLGIEPSQIGTDASAEAGGDLL